MKINFFKKENNFKKKEFKFRYNFYWGIILISTFVVMISSFIFNYYLFMQTNKEFVLPLANDALRVDMINQDRILKALNYFSERKNKSNQILNSPVPVIDPSL